MQKDKLELLARFTLLFAVAVVITAIVMWDFLTTYGTLGHHWDASVPHPQFYYETILDWTFTGWREFGLGGCTKAFFIHPVWFIVSWIGTLGFDGHVISKGIVFFTLFGSIVSMACCTERLSSQRYPDISQNRMAFIGLISGLAYALSPPVFGNIIGGSFPLYIMLPVLPILFYLSLTFFNKSPFGSRHIIMAILLAMTTASPQYFIICFLFMLACFILNINKTNIINYLIVLLITIGLSVHAIVGLFISKDAYRVAINSINLEKTIDTIYTISAAFYKTFLVSGYWGRDFFLNAHPYPGVYFIISLFFISCIALAYIKRPVGNIKWDYKEKFILVIWLITIAISSYGSGILWPIWEFLLSNFPSMQIFRSTQRLLTPLNVLFCFVLSFAISKLVYNRNRSWFLALIFCLVLLRAFPFWYGDFGLEKLLEKEQEFIDNYTPQKSVLQALKKSIDDPLLGRILFLPASTSPEYIRTSGQRKSQGTDPLVTFSPNPAIVCNSNDIMYPLWRYWLKNIYSLKSMSSIQDLASMFSAKHILVRQDVVHKYPGESLSNLWKQSRSFVPSFISDLKGITLMNSYDDGTKLYKVDSFAPMIRPVKREKNVILKMDNTRYSPFYLSELMSNNVTLFTYQQYEKFFSMQNVLRDPEISSKPTVEYKKISATRYVLRIHNVREDFTILMNQTFHPGWKLYLTRINDLEKLQSARQQALQTLSQLEVKENNLVNIPKRQLKYLIQQGLITQLNYNSQKFHSSQFVSQMFKGSIQNDNIPLSTFSIPKILSPKLDKPNEAMMPIWQNVPTSSTAPSVPWPDSLHWRTNYFANGWYIDNNLLTSFPEITKSSSGYYFRNQDGTIDAQMVLDFAPKYKLSKGRFISKIILMLCFLGLIYIQLKKLIFKLRV